MTSHNTEGTTCREIRQGELRWMRLNAEYGARFSTETFPRGLEDAIGSHACALEASMRVTNGIPLGRPLPYWLAPYIRNTKGEIAR
jgi:hypothetical protein